MNYQEGTYTNSIDLLNKFRTFMLGIGWTEAQHIINEFIAVKSNGEDGTEEDIIISFEINGTYMYTNMYVTFVDKDTYTGGSNRVFYRTAEDSPYWFFADLNHFVIVVKCETYLYCIAYAGILKRYYTKAEWTRPLFHGGSWLYSNSYYDEKSLVWRSFPGSNIRHSEINDAQPNTRNGSYILVPVIIYDKANKLLPGELIGMYHIAKEGAEDEGTITIDGVEYKTFKQYNPYSPYNYYPFAFLKS